MVPEVTKRVAAMSATARIGVLAALVLGVEYGRILLARTPGLAAIALLGGGLALCVVAVASCSARELGLGAILARSPRRLVGPVLGGLAIGVVLLLPAAARWQGGPALSAPWALAAIAVSVGEEVAFRGALFAVVERQFGGAVAVVATTLLWTAAHVLSHPAPFLVPVMAAGLLLGLWRWACRDLVAPIIGHVLADLAL
jgi:membrane protease YdiL (CAAX protease family)